MKMQLLIILKALHSLFITYCIAVHGDIGSSKF